MISGLDTTWLPQVQADYGRGFSAVSGLLTLIGVAVVAFGLGALLARRGTP